MYHLDNALKAMGCPQSTISGGVWHLSVMLLLMATSIPLVRQACQVFLGTGSVSWGTAQACVFTFKMDFKCQNELFHLFLKHEVWRLLFSVSELKATPWCPQLSGLYLRRPHSSSGRRGN